MGSRLLGARALVVAMAVVLGCGRTAEPAAGLIEAALVVEASGTVTDPSGAPVAGAQIEFLQNGNGLGFVITGADGTWSASLEEGVYDLYVNPPPDTAFANQVLYAQTIAADAPLQIVLFASAQVLYSVHVQSRDGIPVPDVEVCLVACATTDANGDAVLSTPTGVHILSLYRPETAPAVPGIPDRITYQRRFFSIGVDTSETVTLETSLVTGTIVGPDGTPVANASLLAHSFTRDEGLASSSGWATTTSGPDGRFVLAAVPGYAHISVSPDPASAVAPTTFSLSLSGDQDIVLEMNAGLTYATHVQDRSGSPLAGIELCLSDSRGASVCALSSATGDVVVQSPGSFFPRTLRWTASAGAHPQLPERIDLTSYPAISGEGVETIVIEDRVVAGVVVDARGNPVANATVAVFGGGTDALGYGEVFDAGATDASGRFVLAALPGWNTVRVVPDPASEAPPYAIHTVVEGDADLVITLPDSFVYTAHLVDRDGAPVSGVPVCLQSLRGDPEACAITDAGGDATLTVHEGEHALQILAWELGATHPQLPEAMMVVRESMMISADVIDTITLENRFVSGVVVDADGNPVAHAQVGIHSAHEGATLFVALDEGSTDANGRFELITIAGEARVTVFPAPESGLPTFELSAVSVVEDMSLAVVVQFAGDGVAEPVAAGGTVQTDPEGDGATSMDPVETAVTSPVEGTIEIHEAPITEAAPSGYTLLTQQVNITAPVASAAAPLVIAITIDGSRIPAGQDETTLELFRDGVLVPACDAPGIASPDPCVTARARVGDDVVITALTSAASAWNVGVRQLGDGDGDGLLDDVDVCPIAAEDHDGFQDDDGCPDLDDDGDGVPDAVDACRTEAEDDDGFEDDDGCPEAGPVLAGSCPDFDRDGTVTVRDQVVLTRAMGSAVGDRRYDAALDLDRDGDIDVDDLHRLLAQRDRTCAE